MKEKEKVTSEVEETLDVKGINVIIRLLKNMLKIGYVLAIILGIYAFIVLGKEMGIFKTLVTLLRIISPLFIGIIIAWLFNPMVKWLEKKKIKRKFGTILVYLGFLSILTIIISVLIPALFDQAKDFAGTIPGIFDQMQEWVNTIFNGTSGLAEIIDMKSMKVNLFNQLETIGNNITSSLPNLIITIATSLFKGVGNFIIGLIIGFFFLISFDNTDNIIDFLPSKIKKVTTEVLDEIDGALRTFVVGASLDCLFIFVITSIGLYFVGLKSPLLFGLFCGITNIIPYAGPYIGGAPAVIVGFSQGFTTGILTLAVIVVIQFLEGNFLQPVILSKTTKLHPVTIMLGLLIFGYFWGILGMLVSTPIIAAGKAVLLYFDEKYDILSFE